MIAKLCGEFGFPAPNRTQSASKISQLIKFLTAVQKIAQSSEGATFGADEGSNRAPNDILNARLFRRSRYLRQKRRSLAREA